VCDDIISAQYYGIGHYGSEVNMSEKKCKECGNDVSTKASACPHCGARITNIPWSGITIISILFYVLVVAIVSPKNKIPEQVQIAEQPVQPRSSANVSQKTLNRVDVLSKDFGDA